MATKQSSEKALAKTETNELTVDSRIERMANCRLADVVSVVEFMADDGTHGEYPMFVMPRGDSELAADHLVCRMFTDAVFNEDIRTIQLIINRIDGGLPKDTDMADHRTQFSDCFNEIMQMDHEDKIKVLPNDTVMMALCKALYSLSVQDIYWDPVAKRKRRPSTDKKQERDAARRMVLERTGGRKTAPIATRENAELEVADWIKGLQLPPSKSL